MHVLQQKRTVWLALLLLVISSNIAIYQTQLYHTFNIAQNPQVVMGSLLDLIIVAPILVLCYLKKYSWKTVISLIAAGCIIARLAIPNALLSPYNYVTTTGIAIEVAIIVFELALITMLIIYLPKIIRQVKASTAPLPIAFLQAVKNFTKNPIVTIAASEMLVLYYALASWKKRTVTGISMYKNSSFMALQIMIIHAIVLESLGLHWWLHSKAPVVSIILLIINAYGVVFLIADIRAMKLNPIQLEANGFYVARGIMKRAYIDYRNIEQVITEPIKVPNSTQFVAPDFETPAPQITLKMKSPQRVDFLYGINKQFDYIAITCDDKAQLLAAIEKGRAL